MKGVKEEAAERVGCRGFLEMVSLVSPVSVISLSGFDRCGAEAGSFFHLVLAPSGRLDNTLRPLSAPASGQEAASPPPPPPASSASSAGPCHAEFPPV